MLFADETKWFMNIQYNVFLFLMKTIINNSLASVADPDPQNLYKFPGSGSVSKFGWIRNPDPYQMIRIRIQQKPLKTENKYR